MTNNNWKEKLLQKWASVKLRFKKWVGKNIVMEVPDDLDI